MTLETISVAEKMEMAWPPVDRVFFAKQTKVCVVANSQALPTCYEHDCRFTEQDENKFKAHIR